MFVTTIPGTEQWRKTRRRVSRFGYMLRLRSAGKPGKLFLCHIYLSHLAMYVQQHLFCYPRFVLIFCNITLFQSLIPSCPPGQRGFVRWSNRATYAQAIPGAIQATSSYITQSLTMMHFQNANYHFKVTGWEHTLHLVFSESSKLLYEPCQRWNLPWKTLQPQRQTPRKAQKT